ncbi:MAG: glycosyltransferase family 2 protein [Anaerolineales bacterium]|nr:glycosyltransferase family 2 protein [Anaerolineales bacterium]
MHAWRAVYHRALGVYNSRVTGPFISLIIPAYNEERRLPESLAKIRDFVQTQPYRSEVLIIENGSTDRSFDVAEAFCRAHTGFRVLRAAGRGKGLAVKLGMLEARGELRLMLDADLSMPVEEVSRFLALLQGGVPVVIGSREAPGAVRYNEPEHRHIGGRAINTMIRLLALPGLHDTQCGFKGFRAEAAEALFRRQTIMGWAFDVEILYIARLLGYQILELPIPWYYSPQSHVRPLHDALQMLRDVLTVRRNARQGRYA